MRHEKLTIKNHHLETQLFIRRSVAAVLMILAFSLALLMRLGYLQINQHHFYSTLSRQNLLNLLPVQPNRGLIYDRNGVLLAENIPVFNLDITPARTHNIHKTIAALQTIISLPPDNIKTFEHIKKQYHPYQAVPLKTKLTDEELAKLYVNSYRFPSVTIQSRMMRYYPLGDVMSNVLGYVGRINQNEIRHVASNNYTPSSYIGKVGIEKQYEKSLRGKLGVQEAEIDAGGHVIRTLGRVSPTPGNTLYLTIDSKLQAYAETLFGKNSGSVVAIQPSTGEVLALVTHPSYDPNAFVKGISQKAYQQLVKAREHPLYNRAIRGLYSPGSTIKPFYALAALSDHVITPGYKIFDPGWFQLPNTKHVYHDWKNTGHGWVNLRRAIIVSCDTYFYNLAVMMGMDRMDALLHLFGFGANTNIDMPEELPGLVPSPAWRLRTQQRGWYTGDTIITGIGQGSLLVSPLQLAAATATLAEHGMRLQPHLLLKTVSPNNTITQIKPIPETPVILSKPSIWHTVIRDMEGVIKNPEGTAELFGRHPGYSAAAKTGTAQVFGTFRNEERDRVNIPKHLRNNHLFVVFAPIKHPKIAIAVVVEHASHADEISRKLIDFYFKETAKHG